MITVRPEKTGDAEGIRAVHLAAFPTEGEAGLVDRLRDSGQARVSLLAESDGEIVGHVLFSPVTLESRDGDAPVAPTAGLGLAPVAVLPEHQGTGIGAALIQQGLSVCQQSGAAFVVVLGYPQYYQRFGFQKASTFGLANEYGVDEEFLVLASAPERLPSGGALVKYAPQFGALTGD